jgi:hypothetical protein
MKNAPNPIQLQKHLRGVNYPAAKADLVKKAREQKADKEIIEALEAMPDQQYDGPDAVSRAVLKR